MENEAQNAVQTVPSVDDLKAKYGKVYKVCATVQPDDDTSVDVEFVFKKPSTASYDRYMKTASNGMTKATEAFLYDNIADEYKPQLESTLGEYPALAISVAEKLLAMLGLSKLINLTTL
ncbi:hypothetical protein [Caproicibacter sp.]|uniref:DUF6848 family protein n=1 Tax=Caproicibacter sp. TaxID=2814884 RepID=UPI0039897B5D